MNIIEIYDPSGETRLYSFGNEQKRIKYGTRKYGTVKYGQSENEGVIQSLSATFSVDCSGSEMQSGTMSAVITANKKLTIPKKAKVMLYDYSGNLVCAYRLESAQRVSARVYDISCYDNVGIADTIHTNGFYIGDMTMEEFARGFNDFGASLIVSESIKDDIISGQGISGNYTLREILQYLCVAYGYTATTLGYDGIYIQDKDEKNIHEYTPEKLKENPTIEDNPNGIGRIDINVSKLDESKTETHDLAVRGYVKLSDGDSTRITFALEKSPLNTEFTEVIYEEPLTTATKAQSRDNLSSRILKESVIVGVNLDQLVFFEYIDGSPVRYYVRDFATAKITATNTLEIIIDNNKFNEIADLAESEGYSATVLRQTGSDGSNNGIMLLTPITISEEITEAYGSVTITDGNESISFTSPFVSDMMFHNISERYTHPMTVQFSAAYNGENLGDMVVLPQIYDENKSYSIIESIELTYSSTKIWADFVARILQIEEEEE